ncbi:aldehyde dehydrogenase [Trypanosoma theileri]|uniref:Aldehyde dehydrogenase n=1 Tax=Trypanosoma theileri TaxID=67003 RepID=A0A1X0P348_9TRYP|nr:aldehyde dehydrogenase [Trypanosoma theileri]ORC91332.1 aldehyde dehydrogenase [Trypanosoma theileri]
MSIPQINPATGEKLEPVTLNTVEEVMEAVKNAREAQQKWESVPIKVRAKHLQKMKRFLADNAERAAEIISECNGKTRQDALATEILPCVMACEWYAKNTEKVLSPQRLSCGNLLFANKSNTLEYIPLGVVGVISPWNYPFAIPFVDVIMALMAGNAVILKVATPTTHVGLFIEKCIEAGEFPSGLFTHIVLPGETAGSAFLQAGIHKLFFTGSVSVGRRLMEHAAPTLTPVSLELGGKDAMIVLADAALERAVNCALWAGFQNAGQSCAGVERVFVDASIYEEFLNLLAAKTRALRHGPDVHSSSSSSSSGNRDGPKVDIGSLTTAAQLKTVCTQVEDAIARGARIVAQSKSIGNVENGWFYPATVLADVTPDMLLMKEETFGPLIPVMPFTTEEEAIQLTNNCAFALTNSVFSRNHSHARRVARQLHSGVVTINDHLYSHGMSEAPWGGWKNSGIGRTHGVLGLREMCNVRCINEDCIPSSILHRDLWWFPQTQESYEAILNALSFVAPRNIFHALQSVYGLLKGAKIMFIRWVVKDDNNENDNNKNNTTSTLEEKKKSN